MNGQIIPEETEKSIEVKQENATFLVIGDKAYTSEIIEEYNRNAEAKTEDFNTNAENKTASYNSNAADRTTAFNNNYDNKIAAFNSNANKQTEEFDTHVLMQTNTFNNNAASTIANYNSNAEQKTNEFNQNALSYQEGIDANKKHIINVSNELERVKTDILETGEDTDTFLHLEDSAMAEYQELSVDGVCKQVTTRGYQLLDVQDFNIESNGVITNVKDKEFNISGTITTNWANISASNNFISDIKLGNTYTLAMNKTLDVILDVRYNSQDYAINPGQKYVTFTPTEEKTRFYLFIQSTTGKAISINGLQFTLYEGEYDSSKTFEPYTGNQPSPSPSYPQPIEVIENSLKVTSCNKNLFDLGKSSDYKTGANTTFELLNNGIKVVGLWNVFREMFVEKNTDYFVSFIKTINSGTGTGSISIYTSNRVYIASGSHNFKFNSGENEKVRIYFDVGYGSSSSDITYTNIQVSKENSQYEQHLETQIEANLPEGEFIGKIDDNYKDTLKVEYNEDDGQYHLNLYKGVGKIVLNDYTNISIYSFNNMNGVQFKNVLNENYDCANGISNRSNLVGKRYVQNTIWVGVNSTNVFWLGILDLLNITSVEDFKTWLSTHNTEVYYELATPYVVDLGVVDMPITYNEVTNLFTDSNLMPSINAKYYRNFISTVRNLQINEKALKQELIDINNRLSALESASTSVVSESEVVE